MASILQRLGLKDGRPASPATAAQLADAIAKAAAEHAQLARTLEQLQKKRRSLLLTEDETALDDVERQQQLTVRAMDRLDAALATLRPQHAATAAEEARQAREALLKQHRDAAKAVFERLSSALDEALAASAAAKQAYVNASADLRARPTLHGVAEVTFDGPLRLEAVEHWRRVVSATLTPAEPAKLRDGLVLIRCLRSGIAGVNLARDEVAGMPPEEARRLLDLGVAELVNAADAAKLPPSKKLPQ